MNVFIGLKEVAGNYNYLKQGFDNIGVNCFFLELWEDKYIYNKQNKPRNFWHKLAIYIGRKRRYTERHMVLKKIFWVSIEQVVRLFALIWSVFYFDVYIFSSGSSFFNYLEFPLLKLLGKKIICQFHGSDIRPPYIDGSVVPEDKDTMADFYVELSKKQKNRIKKIEKYADVIINSVNNCHFNEKKVLDILFLGKPFPKTLANKSPSEPKKNGTVRILHSPSSPEAKGTYAIRATIDVLKAKGYKIEYIELTDVPNYKVLEEIKKSDFVIDQLYSDIFMPSFAKEAAFLGKPAIVGGYFMDCYKDKLFDNKIPPTVVCLPEQLEQTCERLIADVDYRSDMGQKVYEFVVNNWNNEVVASHYLDLINGRTKEEYFFDPKEVNYLYGACISKESLKKNICEIVTKTGIGSLQLSDKPRIERKFKEMVLN